MSSTKNLTYGAFFIALGILLPMTFHALGLGPVFLPMHLPVLLAGFFCGPVMGMVVGAATPLLSAVLTGMPPFVPPTAQIMVFELAAYGFLTGLLYFRMGLGVYPALLISMLSGRIVYGVIGYFFLPMFGLGQVALWYPLTYGLVKGIPGIIIQIIFVPAVIYLVERNARVLFLGKKRLNLAGRDVA